MASEIASRKRKQLALSIHDKLKICEFAKKRRTLQSIANKYEIGKSTVHVQESNESKTETYL